MAAMRIPKLDPETFMKAALHYLERYAASQQGLERVLLRRITRAERLGVEVDHEQTHRIIRTVIEKLAAQGFLNDRLFAEGRVASLRRQGRSARQVKQTLQLKGIAAPLADEMVDTSPLAEKAAAFRLAKRRRLGPFATPEKRDERKLQHMAALARAGFSHSIARWVVEGESIAALEAELDDQGS